MPSPILPPQAIQTSVHPQTMMDVDPASSARDGTAMKIANPPPPLEDEGDDILSQRPPVSPITPSGTFARLQSSNHPDSSIMPPPPVPSSAKLHSSTKPPASISRGQSKKQKLAHAPTAPPILLHEHQHPQATFIPPPRAIDFNQEENVDVIALQAALAILGLQKQKCLRDVHALNELKKSLEIEPDEVVDEFLKGTMRPPKRPSNPHFDPLPYDELQGMVADEDEDEDEEAPPKDKEQPKFPHIPPMQKIARCPPINWAKYQVVGEVLDKMHDEQLRRPTEGVPLTGPYAGDTSLADEMSSATGPPAREHYVFKAYDEFEDGETRPQKALQLPQAAVGVSTRRKSRK